MKGEGESRNEHMHTPGLTISPGLHLIRSCLPSRCVKGNWKPHNASVRVKVCCTNKSSPFLLNLGWSFSCRTNTMSPVSVSGCVHWSPKVNKFSTLESGTSGVHKEPSAKEIESINMFGICNIEAWQWILKFHNKQEHRETTLATTWQVKYSATPLRVELKRIYPESKHI
jgi:hypothetical protein